MITEKKLDKYIDKYVNDGDLHCSRAQFFKNNFDITAAHRDFVRLFGRGWLNVDPDGSQKKKIELYKKLAGKRVQKCKNQKIALEIFLLSKKLMYARRAHRFNNRFFRQKSTKKFIDLSTDIQRRLNKYKNEKTRKIESAIKKCIRAENLTVEFSALKNSVEIDESAPDWDYYAKWCKYPKIHHYTKIIFKCTRKTVYDNLSIITADDVLVLPRAIFERDGFIVLRGDLVKNGRGYDARIENECYVVRDNRTRLTFHAKTLKSAIVGLRRKINNHNLQLSVKFINDDVVERIINKNPDSYVTVHDSYAVGNCRIGTENFIMKYNLPDKMRLADFAKIVRVSGNFLAYKTLLHAVKRAGVLLWC